MSYYNPTQLTPFDKVKLREVADFAKKGINPLTVTSHDSGGSYQYTIVDIRNYYESINQPFNLTLRGESK